MNENFESAITKIVGEHISQDLLQLRFGENEKKILRLFYDEHLKARKRILPKFYVYAHFCEPLDEDKWFSAMCSADDAIANLKLLNFIEKSKSEIPEREYPLTIFGQMKAKVEGSNSNATKGLKDFVGNARNSYELTITGYDILLLWHPPIALHLKAWIAVMPPWIVLLGSIAGGIAAILKVNELTFVLFK
ncbi:MAG TPA: hypothetical protein VIE65_11275 [Methylobacter sp.]